MAIGTPTTLGTFAPTADTNSYASNTTATAPADAKVIVVASMVSDSITIPTQTMSGGGLTWTKDHEVSGTGASLGWGIAVHSAHAPSGLASGATLTLSTTPSCFGALIGICYVTGLASASFVDVFDGLFLTHGTGVTAWDTTATSTTVADTLVIGGAFKDANTTSTATIGTELFDFPHASSWTETVTYNILSAAASTSLTGTFAAGSTSTTMSIFVAYKAGTPLGSVAINPDYSLFPKRKRRRTVSV